MADFNCNILYVILGLIILVAVIYYLKKNDDQPIPNNGTVTVPTNNNNNVKTTQASKSSPKKNAVNKTNGNKNVPQPVATTQTKVYGSDVSDSILNDLVAKYGSQNIGYKPVDPLASDNGTFSNYLKKKQLDLKDIDLPYSDENCDDENIFIYKKQKFVKRTPDDVRKLYDVQEMLPKETEPNWFDTVPLQGTKKIPGTHYIHPKVHMGVDTVQSSLRNGTHDIRGDIPNPKLNVGPWGISTIEHDNNIRGICNPI